MEVVKKPWGHEQVICYDENSYMVKRLYVKSGHRLSEQYHKKKIETMILVKGDANLVLGGKEVSMKKQVPINIPPKTIHRLECSGWDATIIEVSTYHPKDVVRLEDDYERNK